MLSTRHRKYDNATSSFASFVLVLDFIAIDNLFSRTKDEDDYENTLSNLWNRVLIQLHPRKNGNFSIAPDPKHTPTLAGFVVKRNFWTWPDQKIIAVRKRHSTFPATVTIVE